jgi:pseudouridylate synthase
MLNWTQVVHPEVQRALDVGRPIVALESTLIAHGLPYPTNLETALESEAVIRELGAVPATIAIWEGNPTIGLTRQQIETLATRTDVLKASRRDLAFAVSMRKTAATTVAATLFLASQVGISTFATGGIGGVHPDHGNPFDISADLLELSRTPMITVCAGAKNILDLPRTLEVLETLSVPVIGYRTDDFPAFYLRSSGLKCTYRLEETGEIAKLFQTQFELGAGGLLVVQPLPERVALTELEFQSALQQAEKDAKENGIQGAATTPYLLSRLAVITGGKTLTANRALIVENARLAARIAVELSQIWKEEAEG